MNETKILLLILVNLFTFGLFAREPEYLSQIQNISDSKYYIIDYVEGNFISEDEKSVVVFFDEVSNKGASPRSRKICVYKFNNNKPEFFSEITEECCYVDTRFIKLDTSKRILGQVYPFGWVGDFNDNGITELMFCQSSRTEEGATIVFVEFHDGKFKTILPAQNDICFILSADKSTHTIEIERSKYSSEIEDYIFHKSRITWNPKTAMYDEILLD